MALESGPFCATQVEAIKSVMEVLKDVPLSQQHRTLLNMFLTPNKTKQLGPIFKIGKEKVEVYGDFIHMTTHSKMIANMLDESKMTTKELPFDFGVEMKMDENDKITFLIVWIEMNDLMAKSLEIFLDYIHYRPHLFINLFNWMNYFQLSLSGRLYKETCKIAYDWMLAEGSLYEHKLFSTEMRPSYIAQRVKVLSKERLDLLRSVYRLVKEAKYEPPIKTASREGHGLVDILALKLLVGEGVSDDLIAGYQEGDYKTWVDYNPTHEQLLGLAERRKQFNRLLMPSRSLADRLDNIIPRKYFGEKPKYDEPTIDLMLVRLDWVTLTWDHLQMRMRSYTEAQTQFMLEWNKLIG